MAEDQIKNEPNRESFKEVLKKRISTVKGEIQFLDETELTYPRVSELLAIVEVVQGKMIPEILINSIKNESAKKTMAKWNTKLENKSAHLSPDMYRAMLLIDFWGQGENDGLYRYINNTKKTATAIFGNSGVLYGTPQFEDIVSGLEEQLYKELGVNNLDELSKPNF